jgi:cyclophilin family peptidyl-prolyl cis-trans isomerase
VVTLQPQAGWIGQFTVLGQIIEGLDVVRKISNVPTSDSPSFRPLTDVHTIHVVIQEKGATAPQPTAAH